MVAGLTLLLLIPVSFIAVLVAERQSTREGAVQETSTRWGASQVVGGPVLTLPYTRLIPQANNKTETLTEYLHVLPEKLEISGAVRSKMLRRGIFDVAVYGATLQVAGTFLFPDFATFDIAPGAVHWPEAFLTLSIADPKGITQPLELNWNGVKLPFGPGTEVQRLFASGATARVPLNASQASVGASTFSVSVALNGSDRLEFLPLGKETAVALTSDWKSPSFQGQFLPTRRQLSPAGFQADWKVLEFNRNFPQVWKNRVPEVQDSAFGVTLFIPVDQYQKTMRSIKYAIMFIALTFLIFFFAEIFNRFHIHPIQYLLVGLALLLFYTLLLSIAEHLRFDVAYMIASLATIGLITAYARTIFKRTPLVALLGSALVVMYGFMYILLQLQDYALLMGSLGLFAVLALVMYVSRNIDWYEFGKK